MSDQLASPESASDVAVEKRDYPGTSLTFLPNTTVSYSYMHSKMVPLHFLQLDRPRSLQLRRPGYLGRHELSRSRRSCKAPSRQCR